MIEITLKFASVALAAAALNQLNGSQLASATVVDTAPVKPVKEVKAEKPAAAASTATSASTSPGAEVVKTPAAAAVASSSEPKVDYPTLQKAVFALVGAVKGKGLDPAEHVLGIAKGFGYANFAAMKDAGPEGAKHFADALAKVNAKAAEVAALEEAVA